MTASDHGFKGTEIAIIGMVCRFPRARDVRQYWDNLRNGVDGISVFSDEEMLAAGIHPDYLARPDLVRAGGVLEDADRFDAAFFGFTPRESQATDPQHRVFLECAWEALEDAGYTSPSRLSIGVYAGMGSGTYLWNVYRSRLMDLVGLNRVMLGNGKDHLPLWASYKLDLTGPSVNVNTACSTSLVAVHLACQSLLSGECDMALAGGVTINTQQRFGYLWEEGGILSRDGRCRAFDAAATGTVQGNGAGIVVLKRLSDALADGDRIRAVIRGSAINNDGAAKIGYTAPSIEGQAKVIAEALAVAEVDPETVGYVETHGTGTLVGDVVEIAALSRAFREAGHQGNGTCAIGSVKASIGHTDTAAGVAGLIKAVLALENGVLPASLSFERPNPEIDFASTPFTVNTASVRWERNGTPRRAGVSSFGMGGTNAHVVLEEAPPRGMSQPSRSWQLLVLSARTPASLAEMTANLAGYLEGEGREEDFADVAYTLRVGRRAFLHRRVLVCRNAADAAGALAGPDPRRIITAAVEPSPRPVAFLFPGQGAQHAGMASELWATEPAFRADVELGLSLLPAETARLLRAALLETPGSAKEAGDALERTDLAQPALFLIEHALASLWMEWGVTPQAMIGHSVGEYVAACLAGVMSYGDALSLVAVRGRLMAALPEGAMLSVPLPEESVAAWLTPGLSLAAVNAPSLCVVSGPSAEVEALRQALDAAGHSVRRLHTSHAFHSAMMDGILEAFRARVAAVPLAPPRIPYVSNLTGTWISASEAVDPAYWVSHLRRTVRFAQGLETLLADAPVCLEVGPGRALGTLVKQVAKDAGVQPLVLPSLRHPGDEEADQVPLLTALGRLWLTGAAVDWTGFHLHETRRRVPLPTYPFERKRYWVDAQPLPAVPAADTPLEEGAAGPAPALQAPDARPSLSTAYVLPRSPQESRIAALWSDLLGIEQIGVHDSFFELGGHSLLLVQVVAGLRELFQVSLPVAAVAAAQTVAELAALVESQSGEAGLAPIEMPVLVAEPERRSEPFPLTEVQEAYWLGRSGIFELGNVATHEYVEYQGEGLEEERLSAAWQRLIARHEMLRAIVLPDGRQQILPEVPDYVIAVDDLRGLPPEAASARLAATRQQMSHHVLPADRWPLFEVRLTRLTDRQYRLHASIDLLILDAWSMQILIDELLLLYFSPGAPLPPLAVSYRDYLLAEVAFRASESYQRSLEYWRGRLAVLPPAPDLPLALDPSSLAQPHFRRWSGVLPAERWRLLKSRAARAGVTPSAILLAAFSEVLASWSRSKRFILNLTLFNRLPIHPQVDRVVGDFTSLTLLAVDASAPVSFEERAKALQRQFWEDLEHRVVSGVRVLRELMRNQAPGNRAALAPVVFTSTLNMKPAEAEAASSGESAVLGENVFGISQTPQVWLDHAAAEANGHLVFGWDVVEDLFPAGLMDAMFGAYCGLLERLAGGEEPWGAVDLGLVPANDLALYAAANTTAAPVPEGLLHSGFLRQARRFPERPAVIAARRTLTYSELARRSRRLGWRLRELGARPNRLVAVVMEKGWEQVVGVLGVLESGAAYLPIDAGLPRERIRQLLERGEVESVVTQPWLSDRLEWPAGVQRVVVEEEGEGEVPELTPVQDPADLAYVIFTSGSTGVPKGVMIDHRGALNTVTDVNGSFGVGADDRIFALSALSFDLSVYDVFGPLAVGGAVVLPEAGSTREPGRWAAALAGRGVTVWNSVPALMEMLVEHLEGRNEAAGSLRLVLLSGDWIPVRLPERIRALWPGSAVISLGGATEASIWSILHPIDRVEEGWKSIPYGRAMKNQTFHVLDERMEPRPVWTPGHLYIGGVGLAQGYWREAEKTAASFVRHPRTGERLYRTGDLGRWLPGGEIEFLGREDLQVKVQGYRIELGEIEAVLAQHPAVRAGVVKAVGEARGGKRLVAYVVPETAAETSGSEPLPVSPGEPAAAPGTEVLIDPIARLEFKTRRLGLRADLDGPALDLGGGEIDERFARPWLDRRSHRKYLREAISVDRFAGLLGSLRQLGRQGKAKYRYPSAGSLYPVQIYVYVKTGQVAGLPGGMSYYDPRRHRLVPLDAGALDGRLFGSDNRTVFEESSFVLFFVVQYRAITPIYGERARDFALLEAGYMGQLLMTVAPDFALGLCPIGGLEDGSLRRRLALEESHELLHLMVGGAIDPVQSLPDDGEADDYELFLSLLQRESPVPPPPLPAAAATQVARPSGVSATAEEVRAFLRERLPEYMVPAAFVVLPALPLSANGKVDRQALPDPDLTETVHEHVAPRDALEREVARLWAQVLGVDAPGIYDNFFELGGHSLLAARLIARVRDAFQVDLSLAGLFEAPTIEAMSAAIEVQRRHLAGGGSLLPALPRIAPDPAHRGEPFPLTDLQYAYWIGRTAAFDLGNLSPQYYAEIEMMDLDTGRFTRALERLIARHDMLRTVILPDGRQQTLPRVASFTPEVEDLSGLVPALQEEALRAVREDMAGCFQDLSRWPLVEVRLSRIGERRHRVHIAISLLVCDAWSCGLFNRELRQLYAAPEAGLPSLDLSFQDYVAGLARVEEGAAYERAADYWRGRLATLPAAPELPLAKSPAAVVQPRFVRRSFSMEVSAWQRFKERVARAGLTPDAALCAVYAEVVASWSKQRHFLLTLLYFNRLPLHPQVDALLGNFSTTLLLEVDLTAMVPFHERVRRVQEQLWKDIEHSLFGGVRVLRDLNRALGKAPRAAVPVVFASTVGLSGGDRQAERAAAEERLVESRLQTPQVWLDHQVHEVNGALTANWDAVEELFPPGLVAEMFAAYCRLLHRLGAEQDGGFQEPVLPLVPAGQLACRAAVNDTAAPVSGRLLQDGLAEQALARPAAPAVLARDRALTYRDLDTLGNRLGRHLRGRDVRPGEVVAILMEKGWEQVPAAFGVLRAGAVYLPIDPALPVERVRYLLESCNVKLAVIQERTREALGDIAAIALVAVDGAEVAAADGASLEASRLPDDLAYVIFTSGSTGLPKGAMIEHRGAVNTIVDINRRFAIDAGDRVLALSSLSFDLSVYDLFGTLAAGGVVVIPEQDLIREPALLAAWLEETGVTVWNSVPALMEMLVDHLEARGGLLPPSLRLVLLSGDWIPLHLPERIAALRPGARMVSLGGATEASIWSILQPIESVRPEWTSIPYGRPMANQRFHVLDARLEPCPDWVPGQLFIGGVGLARGYWGDAEKTAASFFVHPRTGERLYRTGDLGRWLPDGTIEFLGREDLQVKVQGYRIELGEIEAALVRHPGVHAAVVVAVGERLGHKRLVAFVVAKQRHGAEVDDLRAFLQEHLPSYMVPASFVLQAELPLTVNGKVDRGALARAGSELRSQRNSRPPRDEIERRLSRIWEEVLGVPAIGIGDDFFDIGGDSVLAVRLMGQIQRELGRDLPLTTLFTNGTVERLAAFLRGQGETPERSTLVAIQPGGDGRSFFCVHPVGGSILCYVDLARQLGNSRPFYGLQVAEGEQHGLRTVEEMAAGYVQAIRQAQPAGPYLLGGWSMGGVVAYEMARQLEAAGQEVAVLAMIDVAPPHREAPAPLDGADLAAWFAGDLAAQAGRELAVDTGELRILPEEQQLRRVLERCRESGALAPDVDAEQLRRHYRTFQANASALSRYVAQPWTGRLTLFQGTDGQGSRPQATAAAWEALAGGGVHLEEVPGNHYTLMRGPLVRSLAKLLSRALDEADRIEPEADSLESCKAQNS
jgi:amino acid adenylation domain-containing protein